MKTPKGSGIYNVVVIGAGTAGLVTAAGTAGLGGRVALLERNRMGGDCLNYGCVPSKALISSARVLQTFRRAADWGIEPISPDVDLQRIFARMRARRAKIAPHDSQERFESLGVDVFRGEARFVSPHEVEIDGVKLRAKHFVIATGTRAARPAIEGLEDVPYFTNETVFDEMHTAPKRLLVLGGGPIGCELAQAFARFGVAVTLVQRGPRLLPKEEPAVSTLLARVLEEEGVRVLTEAAVKKVERAGNEITAHIQRPGGAMETETCDALLLAAGRTPNIDRLNLEAAGVRVGKRGVEVNEYLQTSQRHIFAAGDITGHYLFTHMAGYQAGVVVRNILMPTRLLWQKTDYSAVPWCTYTEPEIARVGMNESDAQQAGIAYDVFEKPMEKNDRAVAESAETGWARVLVRKGTDRILGVTLVAEHAGDLLQPFVLAMRCGLGLGKIGATIHPYPTFVEVGRQTADLYNKSRLTPTAQRIFAWLYARQRGA